MIRAIIVDDEVNCSKSLKLLLKEYCPDVHVLLECDNGQDAISAISRLQPDVVFLDIEMPEMNGFEILEHFPEISFAVVFTTGYDQYAIKAFRFYALDYLLKPVESKELVVAVHKVRSQRQFPSVEQIKTLANQVKNKEDVLAKIAVPVSDGLELLPVEQVLFCEAQNSYTCFHLKQRKKVIVSRLLKEVEEQLALFPFFIRVHNSYIVNLNEVKKYVRGEGGYLIMSNDAAVNVSRTRKEILLNCLNNANPQ